MSSLLDVSLLTKLIFLFCILNWLFISFLLPFEVLQCARNDIKYPDRAPHGIALFTPLDVFLPLAALSYGIEQRSLFLGIALLLVGLLVQVIAYLVFSINAKIVSYLFDRHYIK